MYKRIIATQGLPGSGKSTWAEEERVRLEGQGAKVFVSNKDEIRKMLADAGQWTWSPDAEKDVLKVQNEQIKFAFADHVDVVIVADCNFGKHKDRLRGLAMLCNAEFEIKDLTSVPLQTCIERDATRAMPVGSRAITDMYNAYLKTATIDSYTANLAKPRAIIVDLDGTLALHNDKRSPYEYDKVGLDDVNTPVAEVIQAFAGYKGYTIIYLTGRDEVCRQATEDWLQSKLMPTDPPHILLMRSLKDTRKDFIVKRELFDTYVKDNYWVKWVFEDRDQVVKMWRELGLSCWQVNYGNF